MSKWQRTPLLPRLEKSPWSAQGHGQEVKWQPSPEVLRGQDTAPETQGEREMDSPPVPQTRPGLQWAQRRGRPAGRRGGKPHSSICPPRRAAGRPAPREQLSGWRGLSEPGGNPGQEVLPHRLEHRQAASCQPPPHLRAGGRGDSGPGPSSFLAQALEQGTTPAFLLGIPWERGLWAGLPLCSGLQLFLPFLNGSGPAGGVLHTRRAPTTPRTWISTLESLPFSWF